MCALSFSNSLQWDISLKIMFGDFGRNYPTVKKKNKKFRTPSHAVSINLPSAGFLSEFNGSCSLSPPQGLYQEVTDLRFRVTDIENERLQCEKKLKATKVSVLKVQLAETVFFDIEL